MKKSLCCLLLALLLLPGCRAAKEAESAPAPGYRSVSQTEAMEMMAREADYVIPDVRTREEFAERRIEGAVCVPNETITGEPIPQLPDKDQLIFVYCRSGNRSRQASEKLAAMGYTDIVEIGGINTWPGVIEERLDGDVEYGLAPALRLESAEEAESDGVAMLVTGYDGGVITARLANRSGEERYYGSAFAVREKAADGQWTDLPWPEEPVWIMIAWDLPSGEEREIACDASALELEAGEYLLVKGEWAAPFTLSEGE